MEIGAQFFTIRDYCKNLESFAQSLKKVADIGYRNVQISGTCDFDAEWLKKELEKNGLKCVITHNSPDKLINDPVNVAITHNVFGCKNVGLGWYGFDEEKSIDEFLKIYTPVAEALRQKGKYFMYHNHDGEFKKINGKPVLETLAEKMEPEIMGFTLDTFWVQAGGGDPAQWIEKLSDRVPCIHLKDFSYGRKMAAIGEGNINFDRVFEKAESAGTKYMLVEQDDCYGEDPFDCLKRSYDFLHSRGFN